MIVEDAIGSVMVPVAYGIAVAATVLLIRHLALRYRSVPARIPRRIGIDGRPSKRTGPKSLLWIAPVVMVVVVAMMGVFLIVDPPAGDRRLPLALMFVVLAEVAWFVAWMNDRHIEVARKMTYRISPARTLRVFFPVLATLAVTIAIAIRP
jgi:hypothetical protein